MKMKRTLTVLMALVMVFLMLPLQALALTVTDKISEVELTVPAPVAGELASRDASIVTVKHHMSYKVTTVNWMKHPSEEYLGVNNAEKYFVGGQTYTVYITLAVKGANSGWNIDYKGTDTDYSGIKATVNGETAEVTHLTLNPDAKTILVKYTFELIPKREITPSVTVPAPTAGDMPPSLDAIKVGNELGLSIAPSEYLWYENDGKSNDCGAGWRKMQSGEAFVAGRNYRVTLAVQANEGFLFPVKSAHDVNGTKYIYGFINGKKISMRVNYIGVNDVGEAVYNDTVAYVTYDFLSCKAKEIGSVSFSGFTIPERGEKPSYTAPTMGDATYALVTDDAITGGAEYGFKNGLSWTTVSKILGENDTFEVGTVYKLSFFVKSDSAYKFTEWLTAWSDVGSVTAETMVMDPTLACITVEFPACASGVLNTVTVGGVREPVKGETPDYNFEYGLGFDRGGFEGDIAWYNASTDQPLAETDVFEYGEIYELRMVLRSDLAKNGASGEFGFAPLESFSVKVNDRETDALRQYENEPESHYVYISVAYECAKAPVSDAEIRIDKAVEGQSPAQTLTLVDDTALVFDDFSILEDEKNVMTKDSVFVAGRSYYLTVTLRTKEGYRIDGNFITAKINGQVANVISYTEGSVTFGIYIDVEELPIFFISFDPNGGSGLMSEIQTKGGSVKLPECEFDAPEGHQFLVWSIDGTTTGAVPETLTVNENITLYPVWESLNEHTHVYGEDFNGHDEFSHYKLCISPNCPQLGSWETKSNMPGDDMGHNWGNNTNCDSVCIDCGYVRTVNQAGEPLHFYDHECSEICPNCGLKREAAPHTPNGDATCTVSQVCTVCDKILVEALGHTSGEEANCGHGKTCGTCGEELTPPVGEHSPGADATCTEPQKCTVCSKELKPASGHSAGVEWITDKEGHHKLCACGEKVDAGAHTDEDGDKLCDVCGSKTAAGLPVGAIVGIVIGAVVLLGGGGVCIYLFVFKKKKA